MSSVHTDPVLLRNLQDVTGLDAASALSYLESGDKVTGDKIFNVAQAVLPAYISSTEGTQRKEELTRLLINPETGQLYTEQEAQNVMLQELMSTAAPQIGETRTYTMSPYGRQLSKSSGKTEQVGDRLLETAPSLQISPMDNPNADFYDAQGNFQFSEPFWTDLGRTISDPFGTADPFEKGIVEAWNQGRREQVIKSKDGAKAIVMVRAKNKLKELGEDFNIMETDLRMDEKLLYLAETHKDLRLQGETDAAFAERLYSTFSDPEVMQNTVYLYSPEGKRNYAESLLGQTLSMKVVGTDENGNWVGDTKMPLNLSQFADNATGSGATLNNMEDWRGSFIRSLAIAAEKKPDEYSTWGSHDGDGELTIRGIRIDGPMPGATEVLYRSPDKKTFKLLIGSESQQSSGAFNEVNEIVSLRNSLNTKRVLSTDVPSENKNKVEGINGKTFMPKKTETKLFLENDSSGKIVPVLKVRSIGSSQGEETDWVVMDDNKISKDTKNALELWRASGNREASYLNDISETRSTSTKPFS